MNHRTVRKALTITLAVPAALVLYGAVCTLAFYTGVCIAIDILG